MRKKSKIISLITSTVLLLSTFVGCGGQDNVSLPDRLDYSNSDKQFNYFAYSSLYDGTYSLGSTEYDTGKEYVNEYYVSEYYDSGMKWILPQTTAVMGAGARENFETSKLKRVLDMAHNLGYDKSVIITDNGIYKPYEDAKTNMKSETDWEKITLFGKEGWQFENEAALDEYIETECLSYYYRHPAFAGVFLPDEPQAKYLKVYGQLYRSVRRVQKKLGLAEMEINANLYPYFPNLVASSYPAVEESFHPDKEQRDHESYRRYVERFLEESGADTLQIDIYPLNDSGVYRMYVLNLQIAAQVAKEHEAKIIVVSQAMTMNCTRILSYEDLCYLNNILMGFGCNNIGYFTYYTHDDSIDSDGNITEVFDDNGSMVTRFGEKTDLYYHVQRVNNQSQKFAPVILNYDYQTSKLYMVSTEEQPMSHYSDHMIMADGYIGKTAFADFKKLKAFTVNKEMAIVTELYDDEKDNYMYMVMNSVDAQERGSTSFETATLTFDGEYDYAWVYHDGEYTIEKLDKTHSLTVKMAAGEAHYVMPFAS